MTVEVTAALAGLRLLVVEDEYMVAEHISMLLEDLGCEVAGPVRTVEEALEVVAGGTLDGVLLDANLDGISSAPIAAALLEASIPFVVVTGYGARTIGDYALDGAPRLIKPFTTASLSEVLRSAFVRS